MKSAFNNTLTIFIFFILFYSFSPIFAQWQKNIIDDDINLAVSVDVADMVGDTKLDLIVTNFNGSKLILYQNNFPQWIKHTVANVSATFAYSGDIDGDDTLDIVASLYREKDIVWYENNHPTWTKHIIDANTDNSDFILVADFDNDDTLDVVTAGGYSYGGDVVWYENNYPIWNKHIIESGSSKYASLTVADIDDDGFLDLVATMSFENKVVWFRNENGGLSWTKHSIDNNLAQAWGINSYDINGDNKIDILATGQRANSVVWYENNYPFWTKHPIDADLTGANWVDVADVNGDDKIDVIASGFSADDVVWYENNHPEWNKNIIDSNIDDPRVFAITDIDGDKANDLVVPAQSSVVWYKNPNTPLQKTEWVYYNSANSELPDNSITCIAVDSIGNKWVGTNNGGLVKFDGTYWTVYNIENSDLTSNEVQCITVDKSNNLWIGVGYLAKFDGTSWTIYKDSNSGLPSSTVSCISIDQLGDKWIGTKGYGIAKYDGLSWEIYNSSNSPLGNESIRVIEIDKANNKWIVANHKIFKLHSDNITWTIVDREFVGDIDDFDIDNENNKWVLSGILSSSTMAITRLEKFDDTNWTVFEDDFEWVATWPQNTFTIDKTDNIWVGIGVGGLRKFYLESWTGYDTTNSIYKNDGVTCLEIDKYKNKWLGTDNGLYFFNEDGIVSVKENGVEIETIPKNFLLFQNYPNPFNPSTTIKYSIPVEGKITNSKLKSVVLRVYDVLGKEVATLVNENQKPGNYEVEFDGSSLSSGIYFYRLQAGDFIETKKMILIK
jgi:hypothetical protein